MTLNGEWKLYYAPEGEYKNFDIKDLPELRNEVEVLMNSLTKEELFDENLSLNELLYRLYHANNVTVTKENKYEFSCRCSREKLLNTLRGFKEEELTSMVDDNSKITAKCGFCSEVYEFTIPEIVEKMN